MLTWPEAFVLVSFLIGVCWVSVTIINFSRPQLTKNNITRIANEVLDQLRNQT